MNELEEFQAYMSSRPSGPIPVSDLGELASALEPVWTKLADRQELRETAMWNWKLRRIEQAAWKPPLLTFDIERHGGLVLGGTRAEVQTWEVNVSTGQAQLMAERHRQIYPMAARVTIPPLVEEVVALVLSGEDNERLQWSSDRATVRVRVGAIPPLTIGYAPTTSGRRKRFSALLQGRMAEIGWERTTGYTYQRQAGPRDGGR